MLLSYALHAADKPGVPPEQKLGAQTIRYGVGLAGGCMMDCGWCGAWIQFIKRCPADAN